MATLKKMSVLVGVSLLIGLLVYQPTTRSQENDGACTDLVAQALQTVGSACAEMGRNEACYGHNAINTVLIEDASVEFEETGDLADIADFTSLETQAANLEDGTWGIAFVTVQADLPEDTDDSLTLVLLGETSLGNDEEFDGETPQAFSMQSTDNAICTEAPDGLLIRSPEGQRARLVINGVELVMSSSLFIKAHEDDEMVLQGLEGEIEVTSDGQTETLESGFVTTVPLDGLSADGAPTPPEPVEPDAQFPLDIFTSLLPDTATSAGGTTSVFPQTYSDENLSFSFPDGWVAQVVPATEFLGAHIALSNNPAYLEAHISDPSTSGNTAPDTVYVLIYTLAEFSGEEYSSAEAAVQGLVEAIGATEIHSITESPTTITVGPHTAMRAQVAFGFAQDTWDGPIYGLGNFVVVIRVTPGEYGAFQTTVEEILGTFVFE